jgi:hypothetical protein
MQSMSENDFECFARVKTPNNAKPAFVPLAFVPKGGGRDRDRAGDLSHTTEAVAAFSSRIPPNWKSGYLQSS